MGKKECDIVKLTFFFIILLDRCGVYYCRIAINEIRYISFGVAHLVLSHW